jgi:hypothetical protein
MRLLPQEWNNVLWTAENACKALRFIWQKGHFCDDAGKVLPNNGKILFQLKTSGCSVSFSIDASVVIRKNSKWTGVYKYVRIVQRSYESNIEITEVPL